MKLSTRSSYGVRLMLNLALKCGQGAVRLNEIAEDEDISEKYLSQLVLPLKSRGLITSARGAGGGHLLARRPSAISLKDIVEALEGGLQLADPLKGGTGAHRRVSERVTRDMWSSLSQGLAALLEGVVLQDLADRYQALKNPAAADMYQI